MFAEGALERNGHVSLIQLWAEGRAFLFDLHAMQPADRKDVLCLLEDELLGRDNVVKVFIMESCVGDGAERGARGY